MRVTVVIVGIVVVVAEESVADAVQQSIAVADIVEIPVVIAIIEAV